MHPDPFSPVHLDLRILLALHRAGAIRLDPAVVTMCERAETAGWHWRATHPPRLQSPPAEARMRTN